MWTPLAIWQIAPQNANAPGRKLLSQRHQQRRIAVPARAMGEHQKFGTFRRMQESVDRSFARSTIDEWLCFVITHNKSSMFSSRI